MKVLVTGASGFVGRAIVAELMRENHEVFCLVRHNSVNLEDLPNIFQADISDLESVRSFGKLENFDVIIHSAGLAHQFGKISDAEFWNVNVQGTENISRLAVKLKVGHFILVSSVSVYGVAGQNLKAVDETSGCEPHSIYARSKFEAEKVAAEICEQNGITLTILRLATVIGENDRGNTARLIRAIDRKRFFWIGSGENRKSLIYKGDVARACLMILEKNSPETEIFNLTGEAVKMNLIVSEISQILKKTVPKISVSAAFLEKLFEVNSKIIKSGRISKLSETLRKWISDDIFSGEKIAKVYGFRAETPISEAIRRQVENYRTNKTCKQQKGTEKLK